MAVLDDAVRLCTRCGASRGVAEFYPKDWRSHKASVWCKPCHRAWAKTPAAKASHAKSYKRLAQRNRDFIRQWKLAHPCVTCGEAHPACLDFHHIDPSKKDYHIGKMANLQRSLALIRKEIAKCVVICANCHRKLHYDEKKD